MANENDAPSGRERPIWLQPVNEPDLIESGRSSRPRLIAIAAALALGLFGMLIWFLYSHGEQTGEPLLVRAPEGPMKVEPEDRGGLEVPHQDKLVFDRISGETVTAAEHLRNGPEQPLARPEVPSIGAEDTAPEPLARAEANNGGEDAEASPVSGTNPAPVPAPATSGGWKVQIAAFQQKRDADTWMIKTKYDHPDIFKGMTGEVVQAKRDMATYFRVRFGPLPDETAARRTCEDLRKVKINCLIVRPE